jgi:hypothetical protein
MLHAWRQWTHVNSEALCHFKLSNILIAVTNKIMVVRVNPCISCSLEVKGILIGGQEC